MKTVAIIIPHFNGVDILRRCLVSIANHRTVHNVIVIVVDNASTDSTRTYLSEWQSFGSNRQVLSLPENIGYGPGVNRGIEYLRVLVDQTVQGRDSGVSLFPDVLVLNNDVELLPFCIDNLEETLDRDDDAGLVGAKLFHADGTIQHAGAYLDRAYNGYHYGWGKRPTDYNDVVQSQTMRDTQFVTGAMILIRWRALQEVGVFDERFGLGYYEDVDLCYRMRDKGWHVVYNPFAQAIHHEGATSGKLGSVGLQEMILRNRNIFISKWATKWEDE
jgi:GT2 family glycosyltransferase